MKKRFSAGGRSSTILMGTSRLMECSGASSSGHVVTAGTASCRPGNPRPQTTSHGQIAEAGCWRSRHARPCAQGRDRHGHHRQPLGVRNNLDRVHARLRKPGEKPEPADTLEGVVIRISSDRRRPEGKSQVVLNNADLRSFASMNRVAECCTFVLTDSEVKMDELLSLSLWPTAAGSIRRAPVWREQGDEDLSTDGNVVFGRGKLRQPDGGVPPMHAAWDNASESSGCLPEHAHRVSGRAWAGTPRRGWAELPRRRRVRRYLRSSSPVRARPARAV